MGTMHSNNIPQNIADGLRLCSSDDVELVSAIVQVMIARRSRKWNDDNFV